MPKNIYKEKYEEEVLKNLELSKQVQELQIKLKIIMDMLTGREYGTAGN